jgi:hypothetical protein
MKANVRLQGEGWYSFGGSAGTILKQRSGSNVDLIRFTPQDPTFASGAWIAPFGISDMTLLGHPSSSAGSGIAFLDASGTRVKMQDLSTLERLCIVGFSGDGIYFEGGSPINITNVATLFNGGYGLRIANPDPATGYTLEAQSVSVVNFSGDANSGGAVIRVENMSADYAHSYVGIKSEQRFNSYRDGLMAQPNVFQFHNCAHAVSIHGLQHISTGTQTTRPGDAIKITGSAIPRVAWSAASVRVLAAQVDGADPALLRDVTNGRTVARGGHVSGWYDPTNRPALTYSRTGESTANAQLRTALSVLGLVTDSTTA